MICKSCQDSEHSKCKGGTWCDCQHRVSEQVMNFDKEMLQAHLDNVEHSKDE